MILGSFARQRVVRCAGRGRGRPGGDLLAVVLPADGVRADPRGALAAARREPPRGAWSWRRPGAAAGLRRLPEAPHRPHRSHGASCGRARVARTTPPTSAPRASCKRTGASRDRRAEARVRADPPRAVPRAAWRSSACSTRRCSEGRAAVAPRAGVRRPDRGRAGDVPAVALGRPADRDARGWSRSTASRWSRACCCSGSPAMGLLFGTHYFARSGERIAGSSTR